MKKKEIFVILGIAVAFILFLQLNNLSITGYTPLTLFTPTAQIQLLSDQFLANTTLQGNIMVNAKLPIDQELPLSLQIGSLIVEKNITSLLQASSLPFEKIPPSFILGNVGLEQTVTQNQVIGVLIPKQATFTKLHFDLEPQPGVTDLEIDVLNDKKTDWRYLGTFEGFDQTLYPQTINNTQTGASLLLSHDGKLYCNTINIPFSNKFEVVAHYQTITPGELRGVITPLVEGSPLSTSTNCIFSNNPGGLQSCTLSFSSPIEGERLVCVYVSSGDNRNYFELATDNTPSGSASYRCDAVSVTSNCQLQTLDYLIGVRKAEYNTQMTQNTNFSSFAVQTNLETQITNYLQTCIPLENSNNCVVPIAFKASSGSVKIKNLGAVYNGNIKEQNMYQVQVTPAAIITIQNTNQTNLTFPLALWNLFLPIPLANVSTTQIIFKIGSQEITKEIEIFKEKLPPQTTEVGQLLKYLKTIYQDLNIQETIEKEVITLVQQDPAITLSRLTSLQTQLSSLENNTLLDSVQKQNQLQTLTNQIENETSSLIRETLLIDQQVQIPPVRPITIDPSYTQLPHADVLSFQQRASITANAYVFEITTLKGEKNLVTYVEKYISAPAQNFKVYEEFLPDLEQILSNGQIQGTSLRFQSTQASTKIKYVLSGNKLNDLAQVTTVIIPERLQEVETPAFVCGDNICQRPFETKEQCPLDCDKKQDSNVLLLVILILMIIVLSGFIVFLHFYVEKTKKTIQKEKQVQRINAPLQEPLFKSATDYMNLKNYISQAIKHHVTHEKVYESLMQAGWTKKQIEHIFEELYKRR